MTDIELVIKVPKDYYEVLQNWTDDQLGSSECFIKHGTPLPTGHEVYGGKEMKKLTEHQIHEFAEQIYNIGFEDGYIDDKGQKWTDDQLKTESEMYVKGLNDAWECARKLVVAKTIEEWDSIYEYMNVANYINIFEKYSASEAIEKIKEYEAKQKQSETSYEAHCKIGHCKDCKYFEYDSMANVHGTPFIIAHNICNKWGNGCKTKKAGFCYMFESQEVGDVE